MLPVLGIPDRDVGTRIWGDLIEKFSELRDEFKGMKVLAFRVDLPHMVHGVKKPIRVPADIKRLKIASFGIGAKILETMGASPVMLMPGDVYMGLERGVAEGGYSTYFTAQMLRILDLLPYHNTTILNWFGTTILMNLKKWNNLSSDIQKVLDEESAKFFVNQNNLSKEYEEKARMIAVKKGHTFIDNTPEEVDLWHEAVRPYQEIWINENEAKGLPARTVYEETRKLVKKYSK
jgi:TRAP-type C4-dicarboxylate transport system substrate-binding protein